MPIDSATLKHEKLYRELRGQVLSGALESGYKMHSERVLAKKYQVNRVTVTRVMKRLESDGLITRGVGSGSYVADRLTTGHIAIVLSPGGLGAEASPFYAKMISALTSQFHARNPRVSLRLHMGRDVGDGVRYVQTLDLLEPDVMKDLRGVFTFHSLGEMGETLRQNNVPVLLLSTSVKKASFCVRFDHVSMVEIAVGQLIKAACKRIGMIWAHDPMDSGYEDMPLYRCAVDALTTGGLKVHPSCLKPRALKNSEKNGYTSMMQLWEQEKNIDGLIVPDDMDCRGVLRAASELGLHLPDDFKLVSCANRGVDFPYPKSVTRVEYDAMELAEHAVRKMINLTSRRPENDATLIALKGRLVEGETT